jgi:hypothetical protein
MEELFGLRLRMLHKAQVERKIELETNLLILGMFLKETEMITQYDCILPFRTHTIDLYLLNKTCIMHL